MVKYDLVFPAALIAPVRRYQSSEETRYYLQGINFRPIAAEDTDTERAVVAAATDGHMLFTLRARDAYCAREAIWSFPQTSAAIIKAVAKGSWDPTGTAKMWLVIPKGDSSFGNKNTRPRIAHLLSGTIHQVLDDTATMESACVVEEIDGTFPDITRVIPSEHNALENGLTPGMQARYVGKIADTAADFGLSSAGLRFRGGADFHSPLLFSFGEFTDAFGVIMPIRASEAAAPERRAWVDAPMIEHSWTSVQEPAEPAPAPEAQTWRPTVVKMVTDTAEQLAEAA